jgi:hypothetical protein
MSRLGFARRFEAKLRYDYNRPHRPEPAAGTCVARLRVNGGDVRDFAIELTDRPGELGRVATALSRYGVNLKAVTGLALEHHVLVRIIADDADAARSALEGAGIRFSEGEVVQVLLENRAGELAAVTAKLAEAKVNLRAIYLTGVVDNLVELAIVTDDPKKAKRMLE